MSERIAIVKLTSLGDIIHTLPVAAAIRDHRRGATIIWIIEERERVLLDGNPVVDEIVTAPLRRWRRWLAGGRVVTVVREVRELIARVRSLAIDVTIDVQGWTHKTSPIVALTRAPMRIGFGRTHARRPGSTRFTTHHVAPPPDVAHVVDQNLRLLEPLGIIGATARFPLPEWPDADGRVDEWFRSHGAITGRPIVVLPSTRGRRKFWPAPAYAALAKRLASATGCTLVFAGSPQERPLLDGIRERSEVANAHTYAPDPIPDLDRFLARASLVIGNDTGPLHLAAAAGVPAIGLFGPTRGARNGPYGPSGSYIQSPSGRMEDISVDAVFNAAARVLGIHS